MIKLGHDPHADGDKVLDLDGSGGDLLLPRVEQLEREPALCLGKERLEGG